MEIVQINIHQCTLASKLPYHALHCMLVRSECVRQRNKVAIILGIL